MPVRLRPRAHFGRSAEESTPCGRCSSRPLDEREAPAGTGSGSRCDVCGHVIAAAQTEYELLFTRAIDSCLHLHRTCYEMWEAERRW